MFFLLLGASSAMELDNVTNTEDSNLMIDNEKLSSSELEDSNVVSTIQSDEPDLIQSEANSVKLAANGTTTNATKVKTSLSINAAHYSKTNTVFKVILKDNNGNPLGNKTISLKVNSKTYKATTGSTGIAYVTAASLKTGTYSVTATYNGDANYVKSSITKKVKVASSISASNMAKTYGVRKYYTATFWKDNGKLSNTTVKITLNGKTYSVKTDSKGVAQVATNLVPGKYTVKMYNPYSKETVSKTIKVNKDSSKITGAKNAYILPKTKYSYSITLKSGQNAALKNAKIYFKYNSKQVTAKTNANGKATITIPALSKGTYTLSYQFKGNSKYKATSGSKKLYVRDSTTTLKSSNLKMQYNDGSKFSAKATDSSKKALANKTIKFTLNGKTTSVTTDSSGTAKLSVGDLKPGTYTVKYTYSTAGSKNYNIKSNSIKIIRQTVTMNANDLVMKYNDGSSYQVTVKNKTGTGLKDITVKFTLNGKNTKVTTDAKGIAKLAISEAIGYYPVDFQVVDSSYYTTSKVTKHILVNGTKFQASDLTLSVNTQGTFSAKLIDGQSKAVANKDVKFTLNSKTQSVKTDTSGVAKLTVSGLTKGTHTVTYTDGSASGSSKINIVDQVTLKDIITASQNVKKYIENNNELPNTVTIGGVTYSTAAYTYLASQAIINLKDNKKSNINVASVSNPSNPKAASNLGNLYDYLSVAKSIVNTVKSKGVMPDSVSSNLGDIGYKGWVYAAARVVAFYDDYSIMPNYVTIKTFSGSTSSSLNSKNTITNLAAYLKSSTNCQVNNAKIKSVVDSLTSGLTTDLAKARAIYNYVRDSISYTFYYDTKYGAVGTLNAKNGNCVDQAHLLIAMYRTAGLAARYVHGTCTFSSGTYGHVWTQVLIGDTWIVADPTSVRNSFGNVVNWNNNNYYLKGYYSSIAF
ncbi:Ig-like domain-containing protein [uncultured Methanobrevibacter sp.]|uniref:Ig-like domain-containing protein n=1 Tax=uncultured Methanobrevibacter sp. TaxID=253161 RepID=UPI002633135D|nr:Ig-like domain repeat protein [uncultured Methanobrevibacter sp.]